MEGAKGIHGGVEERTPESGLLEENSEHQNPVPEEGELSRGEFEKLLEEYDSTFKNLSQGEVVRGKVIKVLENEVIVDVGYKSEGVINIQEFRQPTGPPLVKVGDEVDVLLESSEDRDGYIALSKEKAEKMRVWKQVERAYQTGEVVTGRVVDRIKGGLAVDIGVRAFLPGSLVDVRPIRNLESLRGQEFEMRVIKVNRRRGNIVLSRKAVLEVVNRERKHKTLAALEEGKVVTGVVKNLTEYGAFIDLGGIDGLLHITDMSWGRVGHPSECFQVGQEVETVVLKFDREKERVSLGYKQRNADPWNAVAESYPVGSRIQGKVVSLTDYGAFVELEKGVEGLIHVSEMSWTKRIKHPSKILNVGDNVEVAVLDVDLNAHRLSLGLKQTGPNPWEAIAEKYAVGSRITGQVRNLTEFGAFVEVEEGIDGLVHISDLSWSRNIKHPSEIVTKGDTVEAVVLKIDSDNQKLSLGIKQLTPNPWDTFFASHQTGEVLEGTVTRITDFGAFVEVSEGVEGLVHVSEISQEGDSSSKNRVAAGNKVSVKILRMDPLEKRIALSVKAAAEDSDGQDLKSYRESSLSSSIQIRDMVEGDIFTIAKPSPEKEESGKEAEESVAGPKESEEVTKSEEKSSEGEPTEKTEES
ncbi:MAG: 30S ribosomal protein S1 [Acidobacteriota bacterium]